MRAKAIHITAAALLSLALGCSSSSGAGGDDDDDSGTVGGADGGDGIAQCSNGADDDGDGLVDGFDPECTGPADDLEDSFATGIPGDNIDAIKQDCFFDGDSGHGNDGCLIHTCCLLDGECPAELRPDQFDPDDCSPAQDCIDFCAPLTPPGCDCFGCCTVCNDDGCFDVLTNPVVSPSCSQETLSDEAKCPRCTKVDTCGPGNDCTSLECNLCPGESLEDLPEECGGQNDCPGGATPCAGDGDCNDGQFCSVGCCINIVE